MLRRVVWALVLSVLTLIPLQARAENGFILGIEAGYGNWSIDTKNAKSSGDNYVGPNEAGAFASPITSNSNSALNLHLGWNILGHVAVEGAIHATSWNLFNGSRGGAGFVGGRLTWYPLQIWLPANRKYDAGLEFGSGYSIAGGPDYGMDGGYVSFGVGGEYLVAKSVGLTLNLRHFVPFWSKFYLDYNNNVTANVSNISAGWTTFTVGVNLHVSPN